MAVLLFGEILNVEFFPVKNVTQERKNSNYSTYSIYLIKKYGVRNTKYDIYLVSSCAV